MGFLKDEDKEKVPKLLGDLENEVKVVMFTQEMECGYCATARGLFEEVAELSDKVSLEVHDFVKDAQLAEKYGVDKIPAAILIGDKDYGIRFFGVPAGYEFATLLEDMRDVGRREPHVAAEIVEALAKVDKPVHMQVMISPTCPYCARAVRIVHQFAMLSDHIRGDMVELPVFPHLAVKYGVDGVPKTIINEKYSIEGSRPIKEFVGKVLEAIGKESSL